MIDNAEIFETDIKIDLIEQDTQATVHDLSVFADVIVQGVKPLPGSSPMTSLLPDMNVYCAQELNFEIVEPTYEIDIVDLSLKEGCNAQD